MPKLSNPKREAFANFRAEGDDRHTAYARAGYVGGRSAECALAKDPKIVARIDELSSIPGKLRPTVSMLTEKLTSIAIAGEAHGSAAGLAAARQALVDIARLNGLGASAPQDEQEQQPTLGWVRKTPLTEAEWLEIFAPKPE